MTSIAGATGLDWLVSFADWERGVGWNNRASAAPEWKLGRTRALLDLAGAPDRDLRVVTIAGTNGKGSTGAILESILRAAGHRIGVYSQPHLHDYRERIRIDGQEIDRGAFERGIERLRGLTARLVAEHPSAGEPTTFELTTALAVIAFADAGVEIAILEVGLGGRLDAVNAIEPDLALVTSIGFDHTQVLGRTLHAIATEKAGIFRRGVPALSAIQRPAALRALRRVAAARGTPLQIVPPLARAAGGATSADRSSGAPIDLARLARPSGGDAIDNRSPGVPTDQAPLARPTGGATVDDRTAIAPKDQVRLDPALARFELDGQSVAFAIDAEVATARLSLLGPHQRQNAALAIAAAAAIAPGALTVDTVRAGLGAARWPGRLELVPGDPPVLLDGAHNPAGAAALVAALDEIRPGGRYTLVVGCARDKDAAGLLRRLVDRADAVWTVRADDPRAADPIALAQIATRLGAPAEPAESVAAGLTRARASVAARPPSGHLVVVAGSLHVVAEARAALGLAP